MGEKREKERGREEQYVGMPSRGKRRVRLREIGEERVEKTGERGERSK